MTEVDKSSTSDFGRGSAAYGGDGWRGRENLHAEEIGTLWGGCGIDSEWRRLRRVILHRPGKEIAMDDHKADASLFLSSLDLTRAQDEHDELRRLNLICDLALVVDATPCAKEVPSLLPRVGEGEKQGGAHQTDLAAFGLD